MAAGALFVVSVPSGAGKTTLCRRLVSETENISYSVSYTTRPARPGEVDGHDYFFISPRRFQEMINQKALLEWAEVYRRYYGTGRAWVEKNLALGRDILVDVDTAGARQIKQNFPGAVFIFILPPTMEELARRLKERQSEDNAQLQIRLQSVREEIEARDIYDYIIVNDDIDQALSDLNSVIRAERLRLNRHHRFLEEFLAT